MQRVSICLAVAVILSGSTTSQAQTSATRIIRTTPSSASAARVQEMIQQVEAAKGRPTATVVTAPVAVDGAAPADNTAQQRTQKINQAQFDRRPSVVFSTWSDRNNQPPELDENGLASYEPSADDRPPSPADLEPAGKTAAELRELDKLIKVIQQDVTLGNWDQVSKQLKQLRDAEPGQLYQRMLSTLSVTPRPSGGSNSRTANLAAKHAFNSELAL